MDQHDHRVIAQRLKLLHFQEEAPGMVFWHPRGLSIVRALERMLSNIMRAEGYEEVKTPQILRLPIWEASGHLEHFSENMFFVSDETAPSAVKPVSCPAHLEIVRRMAPSYRDLPLRLSELGIVHRNEPSGTLHGLFRLRQFTQDDGHIFCEEEDVALEVARFSKSLLELYRILGFEKVRVAFATRPESRAGSEVAWDRAESLLEEGAKRAGLELIPSPGGGAFYGPKLEFTLEDRFGRGWQCGTIQVDLVLPERFDISFVDRRNEKSRPVLLHRALFGSIERMLGVLLEHYAGALPSWMAPEQVCVLPIAERQLEVAFEFAAELRKRGLRVLVLAADQTLAKRLREAHELGVPFSVVLGDREQRDGTVSLRSVGGAGAPPVSEVLSSVDALAALVGRCATPRAA